jgi:hypothetical protein
MTFAFVKTQKGMDEMLARKPSIDSGIGSVLLFVDGAHSEADLMALLLKNKLPSDSLELLEHAGFIERRVLAPHKPAPIQQSYLTQQQSQRTAQQEEVTTAFLNTYKYMVGQTKTRLGLRGLSFQFKLERAQNMDDLRTLMSPLADAVAKAQGLSVANEFVHECEEQMSAHKVREQGLRLVEEARALKAGKPMLKRVA